MPHRHAGLPIARRPLEPHQIPCRQIPRQLSCVTPVIPHPPSRPEKKSPISRWEHRYLGEDRFPRALSALEIEHFFTLEADELAAVRQRRSALNGLALALQVGFLRMTGRTLNS
ncbi:MAG: DUF4158 domain-containing protein, partial [Terriglobia bacterium]